MFIVDFGILMMLHWLGFMVDHLYSLQIPFKYSDNFCFHVWLTSLLKKSVIFTSGCLEFYCMALSGSVPGINVAFLLEKEPFHLILCEVCITKKATGACSLWLSY